MVEASEAGFRGFSVSAPRYTGRVVDISGAKVVLLGPPTKGADSRVAVEEKNGAWLLQREDKETRVTETELTVHGRGWFGSGDRPLSREGLLGFG